MTIGPKVTSRCGNFHKARKEWPNRAKAVPQFHRRFRLRTVRSGYLEMSDSDNFLPKSCSQDLTIKMVRIRDWAEMTNEEKSLFPILNKKLSKSLNLMKLLIPPFWSEIDEICLTTYYQSDDIIACTWLTRTTSKPCLIPYFHSSPTSYSNTTVNRRKIRPLCSYRSASYLCTRVALTATISQDTQMVQNGEIRHP